MSAQRNSGRLLLSPGGLKAGSEEGGRGRAKWDAEVLGLLEQILEQLQLQTAQHEAQGLRPTPSAGGLRDFSVSVASSLDPYLEYPRATPRGDWGADVESEAEEASVRTETVGSGDREPSARTINRNAMTPDGEAHAHLSGVSGAVKQMLFVAAVLPRQAASPGWRRRGYELYCVLLAAAWALAGVRHLRDFVVPLAVFGRGPSMTNLVLTIVHFFVVLPFWRVWKRNFGADARLMRFFQQMARQRFPWSTLRPSVRLCWAAAAVADSLYLVYALSYVLAGEMWFMQMDRRGDGRASAMRAFDIFCDTAGLAATVLWVPVNFIHMWAVYFVCRLHQHDLLCYASAVKREIETTNSTKQDTVQALRELEARTTTRLRHASQTWVQFVVLVTCGLSTGFLVTCLHLLSEPRSSPTSLAIDSVVGAAVLVASACLATPLAVTAETFEHDVLRALNNPLVMERSQRLFGQQFLKHLVLLQWGFRFGGSVITVSMVRNIIGALFVTMVTSVSRAFIARANLL